VLASNALTRAGSPGAQVVFEGVPNYPDVGRCWDICDKYKVTAFYTAPTLIRSLMGAGDDFPKKYALPWRIAASWHSSLPWRSQHPGVHHSRLI